MLLFVNEEGLNIAFLKEAFLKEQFCIVALSILQLSKSQLSKLLSTIDKFDKSKPLPPLSPKSLPDKFMLLHIVEATVLNLLSAVSPVL